MSATKRQSKKNTVEENIQIAKLNWLMWEENEKSHLMTIRGCLGNRMSLAKIGKSLGISRQRVQQIIEKHNQFCGNDDKLLTRGKRKDCPRVKEHILPPDWVRKQIIGWGVYADAVDVVEAKLSNVREQAEFIRDHGDEISQNAARAILEIVGEAK